MFKTLITFVNVPWHQLQFCFIKTFTLSFLFHFVLMFFYHCLPLQMEQRLWATDISLRYSDSLAMFQLMSFVSNGTLNTQGHVFDVPPAKQESKKRRRRLHGQDEEVSSGTVSVQENWKVVCMFVYVSGRSLYICWRFNGIWSMRWCPLALNETTQSVYRKIFSSVTLNLVS